jgi:hypothetical protein
VRLPPVATEGHEVRVPRSLIADQALSHGGILRYQMDAAGWLSTTGSDGVPAFAISVREQRQTQEQGWLLWVPTSQNRDVGTRICWFWALAARRESGSGTFFQAGTYGRR